MSEIRPTHGPASEPLLKRAEYDAALRSYEGRIAWFLLFGIALCFASLYVISQLFKRLWPQLWNGPNGAIDDGVNGAIVLVTMIILSVIPLALVLAVGIKRLRKRPCLRCCECGGELASGHSRSVVLYSSYCPWCEQKLLADEERETVSVSYETLLTRMRGHLRFAKIAWGIATPFLLAIAYFSSIRLEWQATVIGMLVLLSIPVPMLGMMWFVARSALKRTKWLIELNQKK
ncbi:MAG: hypothetical protein ACKVT0_04995 [Planctomycetaceae bacterium]